MRQNVLIKRLPQCYQEFQVRCILSGLNIQLDSVTRAIRQWHPTLHPNNRFRVARYDESYTIFLGHQGRSMPTTPASTMGWPTSTYLGFWWRAPLPSPLCCPLAMLLCTELVSALTLAAFYFCALFNFVIVVILHWQDFNSWYEHPICTVLVHLESVQSQDLAIYAGLAHRRDYSYCIASEQNWKKKLGPCFCLNCQKYLKNSDPCLKPSTPRLEPQVQFESMPPCMYRYTQFLKTQIDNTVDDYFELQIAQNIVKSKIEDSPINAGTWLSNIAFHLWSCCAVWLEFEQTPFSRTGSRLRSAP